MSLFLSAVLLAFPASPASAGGAFDKILTEFGVTATEAPVDQCPKDRQHTPTTPCYKVQKGDKTALLNAPTEQLFRKNLEAAGFAPATPDAKAAAAIAACPKRQGQQGPRDLADSVVRMQQNGTVPAGVSAADFLVMCAPGYQGVGTPLQNNTALTRDKAEELLKLAQPKRIPGSADILRPGFEKTGPRTTAVPNADEIAKTSFGNDPRMDAYFKANPDKAAEYQKQYAACAFKTGREKDDCFVGLRSNWSKANPAAPDSLRWGNVKTDKIPGLQQRLDAHFKGDAKRQEALRSLFTANPRLVDSFTARADRCDKAPETKRAACSAALNQTYRSLADGRPQSDAGRVYMRNACTLYGSWSKQQQDQNAALGDSCAAFAKQAPAKKKPSAIENPVVQRRPAAARPAAPPASASSGPFGFLSSLFGGKGKSKYLIGTDIACGSAPDSQCEWR